MKAITVSPERKLILSDVPSPSEIPPPNYLNIAISSISINAGDKTFLRLPPAALAALYKGKSHHNIWGASAAGTVIAVGEGAPASYVGRKVAIYRGLKPDKDMTGLWSETAQIHFQACLLLPEDADCLDYSGSLVNVVTAYAFLDTVQAEGHTGVVVTAGNSATGKALVVLARERGMEILVVVRKEASHKSVLEAGVPSPQVLSSASPSFLPDFEKTARELGTTAVFDGVGGTLMSQLINVLPVKSSIYLYGFLGGPAKIEFMGQVLMMKDLKIQRFSNFNTVTVQERLGEMLAALEGLIGNVAFRTVVGERFEVGEVEKAMAYEAGTRKAALMFEK